MNCENTVFVHNRVLRVHTVAKRLGVAPRTVRYWAKTGLLPASKSGVKLWAFNASDVAKFAARRPDASR
jgi:excisionase family DNA binding protein